MIPLFWAFMVTTALGLCMHYPLGMIGSIIFTPSVTPADLLVVSMVREIIKQFHHERLIRVQSCNTCKLTYV